MDHQLRDGDSIVSRSVVFVERYRAFCGATTRRQIAIDVVAVPEPAPGGEDASEDRMSARKRRIELNRASQPVFGLPVVVRRTLVGVPQTPHATIEGIKVGRSFVGGAPAFTS
jgi:hypothetical protein